MDELEATYPADDGGDTALAGFSYQSKVAFAPCLQLALSEEVQGVYLEHHEDIVVAHSKGPLFIQVKGRSNNNRVWGEAEICDGPLASLHRAFERTGHLPGGRFMMLLEGRASEKSELVRYFRKPGGTPPDSVATAVGTRLGLETAVCAQFLQRVRLRDRMHGEDTIDWYNRWLLGSVGPHITNAVTAECYKAVVTHLHATAMSPAEHAMWHESLKNPDTVTLPGHARKIVKADVSPFFGPFSSKAPSRLLRRANDADLPPMTRLEGKLINGGATPEIIKHAKRLRAQATERDAVVLGGVAPELGEDLLTRLEIRHEATRAMHLDDTNPARSIWNALMGISPEIWRAVDYNNLLNGDPFLLIGKICDMSDQCTVDFGEAKHGA